MACVYEQRQLDKKAAQAERERRIIEEKNAAQAEIEKQAAEATLATMTPNQRRIEEFKKQCAARAEQNMGNLDNPNTAIHNKARELAKAALNEANWSADEKRAVAEVIEEWLPKLVKIDIKDERKKLRLSALRA